MSVRAIDIFSKSAFTIVPSASAQPRRPNGIYVGVTGNVVVKNNLTDPDVTFVGVPAGAFLRVSPLVVSACTSCVGL